MEWTNWEWEEGLEVLRLEHFKFCNMLSSSLYKNNYLVQLYFNMEQSASWYPQWVLFNWWSKTIKGAAWKDGADLFPSEILSEKYIKKWSPREINLQPLSLKAQEDYCAWFPCVLLPALELYFTSWSRMRLCWRRCCSGSGTMLMLNVSGTSTMNTGSGDSSDLLT